MDFASFSDFDQDEVLKKHETRIKRLERAAGKDEKYMSPILKSLVGRDCYLSIINEFSEIECRIEDVDDEWVKLTVYKKKEVATEIIRVENVGKIKLK